MSVAPALAAAFTAGLTAFGESVSVGGTAVTAVVTGVSLDSQFVDGGTGESGGKSIAVAKTELPAMPEKMTPCVVRGQTLQVVTVLDRLVHWQINLGNVDSRS